jgi:hypothetical protein
MGGAIGPDMDGDGKPEILIQVLGIALGTAPRLLVYSGAQAEPSRMLIGKGSDRYWLSISAAGDLDGDGLQEVAAGFIGPDSGERRGPGGLRIFRGKDGALMRSIVGPEPDSSLGCSVVSAGDLDGDGVPDLLSGLCGGEVLPSSLGGVAAISGKDGRILYQARFPAPR